MILRHKIWKIFWNKWSNFRFSHQVKFCKIPIVNATANTKYLSLHYQQLVYLNKRKQNE